VSRLSTLPNCVASIAQRYTFDRNNQDSTSKVTAQEMLGLKACDMTAALIVSILTKLHFHQNFTAHNAVKQYTNKTQRNVLMHHCNDAARRVQTGSHVDAGIMLPCHNTEESSAAKLKSRISKIGVKSLSQALRTGQGKLQFLSTNTDENIIRCS